ncbi:MAG TPA: hypothetical protein DEQ85_08145 [Clostridiales bacterium]|nr:hypothetical protein [Clostridiales bacterium]
MSSLKTRIDHIRTFMEDCRGKQLIFLYQTPDGKEKRGNIDDLISDNGTFLGVLSGNRLEDLDRMLAYEMGTIL